MALSTNTDGLTKVVRSRIVRDPDGINTICGEVAELPAVMAAGIRTSSISPSPIVSIPSPVPETMAPPDTGGNTLPAGGWLILTIFGLIAVAVGVATLKPKRLIRTLTVRPDS